MRFVIEMTVTDGSVTAKNYPEETPLGTLLNEFGDVTMLTLVQSAILYSVDDGNIQVTLSEWART